MPDNNTSAEGSDRYDALFRVEDPSKYKPGGYHPLEIGEEIHNGRYLILHRLGHGGYSTVWLALDQSYDNSTPGDSFRRRYVAIKIVTASRGQQEATLLYELQALLRSRPAQSSLPGRHQDGSRHIVTLLDYFQISGPNGSHCCLVTEPLGPSVAGLHRYPGAGGSDLLPLPIARSVAMQSAEALAVLHSRGIVHADLYPGNLAFAITADINSWTVEQLYAALGGEPVKISHHEVADIDPYYSPPPDTPSSHQPKYFVATPSVSHLWAMCTVSEPQIRIIDFSESFHLPFQPDCQPLPGTPREFAAPELLLSLPSEVALPIDVWSLGCIIYSLFGYGSPFVLRFGNLSHLQAQIIILTGGKDSMPDRFWHAFSQNPSLKSSEEFLRTHYKSLLDWDSNYRGRFGPPGLKTSADIAPLETEDLEVLRAVIAATLVIDPAKRVSAKKLLEIMRELWGVSTEPDVLDTAHDSAGTRARLAGNEIH